MQQFQDSHPRSVNGYRAPTPQQSVAHPSSSIKTEAGALQSQQAQEQQQQQQQQAARGLQAAPWLQQQLQQQAPAAAAGSRWSLGSTAVGGTCSEAPPSKRQRMGPERFTAIVKDMSTGGEIHFKVARTTPVIKLFEACCKHFGLEMRKTRFLFDGACVSSYLDAAHTQPVTFESHWLEDFEEWRQHSSCPGAGWGLGSARFDAWVSVCPGWPAGWLAGLLAGLLAGMQQALGAFIALQLLPASSW
jgi:hypothetical protein